MIVQFKAFDLTFDAHVEVCGRHLPATFWDPAEHAEVEITELFVRGHDASFMLDSDALLPIIQAAAESAVAAADRTAADEAAIEHHIDRLEYV